MPIYLPIAELALPAWLLITLGAATGVLSGLFGIGGGFILTPLLMFIGVDPAIAVASSACLIMGTAFSGFLHHWKHRRVDTAMGNALIAGGIVGSALGILIFASLRRSGHTDIAITLMYVCLLAAISLVMLREGIAFYKQRGVTETSSPEPSPQNFASLPFQYHFTKSQVTHSLVVPITLGLAVGMLVSLMGVGGGFVLIPAMVYVLRMPSTMIVGTSLYQIIFITAFVTLLHAITTQTVDLVLAVILMIGSVVGAQFGARWGTYLPNYANRLILAALLIIVAARLASDLFTTPSELFTIMAR
jgi:uncharacterized membrane protein YfcA